MMCIFGEKGKSMKYRLALFDLDGTVLNTLEDLADSLNAALERSGFPPRKMEEVRRFVGNGIPKLVERGVPAGTSEESMARVLADFMAHYTLHCADHTRPYAGIAELLAALRERGVLTAVVSNKADEAVRILCGRYFSGLFDAVSGAKQGVRKKPAPDTVNRVLAQLQICREDAVYIGDSEVDVETAQNAGMDCISVDWGFRSRAELLRAGATTLVSRPMEILRELSAGKKPVSGGSAGTASF